MASANLVPFFAACCICCAKRSFLSKITPRYRASCDGSIVVPVIVMFAVGVVLLLVKCEDILRRLKNVLHDLLSTTRNLADRWVKYLTRARQVTTLIFPVPDSVRIFIR